MISRFTLYLSLFFLLLFGLAGHAQTTYTINGTGNWNNPAIWTPNGVPGADDVAIINAGTITLTDHVTLGSLYMSAGVITGDSNITVTDSLSWSGGQITYSSITSDLKPTLTIAGTANSSFNGNIAIYRNTINDGEVHWINGELVYNNESIFENKGTFIVEATDYLRMMNSPQIYSYFYNYGSFIKQGAAENYIGIYFLNLGEVDINAGRFTVSAASFTDTGSYTIAEGSSIFFVNGRIFAGPIRGAGDFYFSGEKPYTVSDTFNITGLIDNYLRGKVSFTPGSTFLPGPRMINLAGSFTFNTGKKVVIDSIQCTSYLASMATYDSLVIKKYASLSGGTFGGGTGKTIIDQDAKVYCTASINFRGQIDNYGRFHWENGDFRLLYEANSGGSPIFNNYGLFLDQTTVPSSIVRLYGIENHNFNNFGTYLKENLSSTEFADLMTFVNKEDGILKGVGNIIFVNPVVNAGTVSPGDSVGVLNLKLDYPSESTSSVIIEIGGTMADTEYDRLEIDGNATLKGSLNIQLLDDYLPDVGDIFDVMKFTTRTDSFDVVNGLEISNCRFFDVQYSDTAVRLEVFAIEPPQANKDTISERQDTAVEINVLSNDIDPDNDSLFLVHAGTPLHGTSEISGDSTILYTPEDDFSGMDSLIYIIQKQSGCIDTAWVVIDVQSTLGMEEVLYDSPNSFSLEQNFPNPFSVSTRFNFSVPEDTFVEIRIYDLHGRLVDVLVSEKLVRGSYGYDYDAAGLAEGIYFYKFSAGEFVQTKKLFKLK